jgi:FkbM family methyltransferase
MTVLDVGASFGLYSLAAARTVGPSGRVYAFEPARGTASALRRHLDWNGAADRVEVVEAAAAEQGGSAVFWEQETSFVASLVEAAARQEQRRFASPLAPRPVRTVALDEFCRDHRLDPDVVKVDVEGGEAAVLRGSRDILARGHALLFLEVHATVAPRGDGPEAVFDELRTAGWAWEELGAEVATRHYACTPPGGR